MVEKICTQCQSNFTGKYREVICDKCAIGVGKRRSESVKDVIKDLVCNTCDKVLGQISKRGTRSQKVVKSKLQCEECYQHRVDRASSRMSAANNPNWQGGIIKENKYQSQEERSAAMSIMMKQNNPSHKESAIIKACTTKKKNIADGVTVYKKGIMHHLWKGNRPNDKIVRSRLNTWRKVQLEKNVYTCQECGKTNCYLEIHHTEPLREIYKKISPNKSLSDYDCNTEEFQHILDKIEHYHLSNDIGYVCCKECHGLIDEHRRLKNEN